MLLETQGVVKRFGDLVAVDQVDFGIETGEVVGIIGPNGAGKTTFVNLITGVLPVDAGTVRFRGADISGLAAYERAREGIVRSFQIPKVCEELTLLENVRAAVLSRERRTLAVLTPLSREHESREEALAVLDRFGLADAAEAVARAVPHGDRKILDVAMSATMNPEVLILDEPTSGVATAEKTVIMDRLMGYIAEEGMAVILITHDMGLVADYSDRVMAMANGRKIVEGDPGEVLDATEVRQRIRGVE